MNLETQLTNLLPEIFKQNKRVSAKDFWKEIEVKVGKNKISTEVYQAVCNIYQKGILGLSDGNYYLR